MSMIAGHLEAYLALSGILFAIGSFGFLARRNAISMLMSIELMLNAVNLSAIAFGAFVPALAGEGTAFALLVIAVAAAEATRPGARFNDPHQAAVRVLAQGLLDEGLLNRDRVGGLDDVLEKRAYFPFYMHRTSHWLGMDVHDCGSYVEPGEPITEPAKLDPISGAMVQPKPSRVLRPGMVLTLEPGLYVRPAEDIPEAYWGIGIRIEDDAIVTPQGCELITRDVPVEPDAIEALMRG